MIVNADFLIDKKLFKNKQIAKIIKTFWKTASHSYAYKCGNKN